MANKHNKVLRIAAVFDTHAPFQDDRAIELTCKIIEDFKPDKAILGGDLVDMYALSTFSRDPARVLRLQEELDISKEICRSLDSASAAEWYFTPGNHEKRAERWLWKHPEIAGLEVLTLENLLDLPKGWRMADTVQMGDVLFTHGQRCSRIPGRAVRAEMADRLYQAKVMFMGHGHSTGQFIMRGHTGVVKGYEVGCLCDLHPDYRPNNNWTQSIALITMLPDIINVEQVIFEDIKGEKVCIWRGRRYAS